MPLPPRLMLRRDDTPMMPPLPYDARKERKALCRV